MGLYEAQSCHKYNHHTEFVCGLDLSLHSNTKVQYNPHYRLSVLNFVLFKSEGPDGAIKYLQETWKSAENMVSRIIQVSHPKYSNL